MNQKYERQTRIPEWDQSKLDQAQVAVVGAGALGNHVCLGLMGLGIGTIKIYDYDNIEIHNLNRQSLFCEDDVDKNKAETLAERLEERNSSIMIVGIDEKIEEDTVEDIIGQVDLVIDCVDRIYVRKILSQYCLRKDIPLVHGGISWKGGEIGVLTRKTPCINCIYPDALQQRELTEETSCTRKPEPSVVYISQIVAGFMVEKVREVLLPLSSDVSSPIGLIKLDFRLHPSVYFQRTRRREECICREILHEVAPEILEREDKALQKEFLIEKEELAELIDQKQQNSNKKLTQKQSSRKPTRKSTSSKLAKKSTTKKPVKKSTTKKPIKKSTTKKPVKKSTTKKSVKKSIKKA